MIAAFMVGAAVHGFWIYVSWRFRESNKRYNSADTTTHSSTAKSGGHK
jgi:heme/copper-type cytochrome/quinol oxidase subunit 2